MRSAVLLLIIFAGHCIADGQQSAVRGDSREPAAVPLVGPSPTPYPTKIGKSIKRWFDMDASTLQTRYRSIGLNNGKNSTSQQQWQALMRGHFQFDQKGKYRVNWRVNTGQVFTTGWNNTGLGTGLHQTNLYVKDLYFDAKPTKKFEFQIGGLDFNRGETTEVISYDNDGYLTGERIAVRAPKSLYFDEISATVGYVGDVNHPSVFYRFKQHVNNFNYHQFLVRKQVAKTVGWSADYSFQDGRDTFHEALRLKDRKRLYFDTLLYEMYERVDPQRDAGFNIFAERTVNKHVTLSGGFARIDRRIPLNADRFPPGKRLYITALYKIDPAWSVTVPFTEGIGALPTPTTHRRRFEIILTYNLLEDLHRHHVL